ncbi:NADH dehydrogenase 1 alpha subcomplex assembly factor 3, partial [Irpex rosettiformis]
KSESPTKFTNILAGANALSTQVKTFDPEGIHLEDGRIVKGACIFVEGKVFLWNVPQRWEGWKEEHFEVFKVTVPKPELLLFGTGKKTILPPGNVRAYLGKLGVTTEFMDSRNACATYNLLAEEGRRVAAALLPSIPFQWK